MSGISIGHNHLQSRTGEKTLRRCKNIDPSDSVIVIDVDTESFDNVVHIDVPESLPSKKTHLSSVHRKDKTLSIRNIVYIDDEENHETDNSFGVNRESCGVSKNPPSSPVRLSKCKRTYSGKGSKRNRYGLNADSEIDLSDDGFPDCELVEDSSGKVQEQWERASSRRKKDFRNQDTSASVEMCIINEQEKLKESDEHKTAMYEEWVSQKNALRIQAEEVKRLQQVQKKNEAESKRLLDMEKRQNERIEEVRDNKRKDEENMDLKEKISAEVRNELKKLEYSCRNMASLLHLLGVSVCGWPKPSPKQVQTAYKRALLTFHPDRASQSDIRQQVEAEEKFKLINRLKDKLSLL